MSAGSSSGKQTGKQAKQKETLLAIETKKNEAFSDWYSEVITKSEMLDYYDISGCYILRPWSFAIWESIKDFFDGEIKRLGVQNAYFPLFVSKKALQTEESHIEGFAPEVAWVTHSGSSPLPEHIAVRPTSETIMYPAFANWIKSHRDLPLKLNQWSNVVRWEFKHPVPFLRSREFLWQEGHSVFVTKEEADEEVLAILELYRRVYEELLAVPVIKGRKTEKEKFAGGLYTTSVEGFIPTRGWGIQGATSHCLGQNFSKMFGIEYETNAGGKALAWQNSWGLTTRTIGVCVMVHGDDKGLVLPPRIAPLQVIIIPIYFKDKNKEAINTKINDIFAELTQLGVRSKIDNRENYTPGWKYNHWELKGVPLRIELGPKDVDQQQVMVCRRDTGAKCSIAWANLATEIPALLNAVQEDMFNRAKQERDSHVVDITTFDELVPTLDGRNFALAPWCDQTSCEDDIKLRSSVSQTGEKIAAAKSLCIPFEQAPLAEGTHCFACSAPAKLRCLFGRSY